MADVLLSAQNLCAGYHGKEILHDVTVGFQSGKITVIAGQNGCGKSTLLKAMIRLIPKNSGSVLAGGTSIEELSSAALARRVSYLPQNKPIPDLTVMTMVLHGRFAHLGYPRHYRKEDIEIASEVLRITELTEYADEYISHLSGGTQQRVFLAMALAQSAPVILMDEPTSFMDLSHQRKFMELCRRLADQGKAVVMVLHDLPSALKYADEIVVMSQGKIVSSGNPQDVFESGILNQVFEINLQKIETPNGTIYY